MIEDMLLPEPTARYCCNHNNILETRISSTKNEKSNIITMLSKYNIKHSNHHVIILKRLLPASLGRRSQGRHGQPGVAGGEACAPGSTAAAPRKGLASCPANGEHGSYFSIGIIIASIRLLC